LTVRSADRVRRLRLVGGRVLGYAEYGEPTGWPVFFLHGFPGSRLAAQVVDEAARSCRARVIAPERPGIGFSSAQPGRTLLDHAKDVAVLADQLGVGGFSVLGESGGGPYALAAAYTLPDRIDRVAVINGLGPVASGESRAGLAVKERIGYALAAWAPRFSGHGLVAIAAWARRWPRQFLRVTSWELGDSDREALRGPLGDLLVADFVEAFREGGSGIAQELALLFRPWPFDLSSIRVPVLIFHGAQDRTVSVAVSRQLARRVPNAHLRIFPRDGHYSLLTREAASIFAELAPDNRFGRSD
jgi:pimeloyl-ACP methyl ester carboxylesterase